MYLMYDVIQLRKSSLSNKMLIKRQHWTTTTNDMAGWTLEQLQNAAKALSAGQPIDDPAIQRLQRNLITIGMRIPGSFAQKLLMRAEIRGLIVRHGMPAFWLTINPSDLRHPLVLVLAGMHYSDDALPSASGTIREVVATSNPVAVAQFFHYVCKSVLHGLIASNTGEVGILGDVANHYGVVETNGRGMLHMHALIWVRGNLDFRTLRDHLHNDGFATGVIQYLESIISQSLHDNARDDPESNLPGEPSYTDKVFHHDPEESDAEFMSRLALDSNTVACKKQLHSKTHLATCFKYHQRSGGKRTCRFGMPRDLVETSHVDEFGLIHLARNHAWVNSWNPAIASCLRSNHDISWILTVSQSLALLYYITNYATKDDISPWQIVAKAALLKQSIDNAKTAEPPTATDLRLRERGMDNFSLRCFNTLVNDREVSGVQVESTLLHLPAHYTINDNFVRVHLGWLRRYVRAILAPPGIDNDQSSNLTADKPCSYEAGAVAPASIFDNYKWRGSHLADLSFFEYCMLVQMKSARGSSSDDLDYDPAHPRYDTHVQRLARTTAQIATVAFTGPLTEFQTAEDAVRGGHPETEAIMNDLAEILLDLFVPWDKLANLFVRHATQRNPYSNVWQFAAETLPPHNQEFARNIDLLRKSKEDCQADAKLRQAAHKTSSDSFEHGLSSLHQENFYSDDEDNPEHFLPQIETFNAE